MLRNLPSVGHVARETPAGCIFHHQSQVCLCEDCLKGIDDVDMPLAKVGLDLRGGKGSSDKSGFTAHLMTYAKHPSQAILQLILCLKAKLTLQA